jgi:hypothetical protein
MTAQPLTCSGCADALAYARQLGEKVRVRCQVCQRWRGDRPARPAPAGAPRNALLVLLRDCAAMATWDGRTAPAPTSLKRPDEGGEVRASGAPSSEPPDWVLDARTPMQRAADLRAKLDRLTALGRLDGRHAELALAIDYGARAVHPAALASMLATAEARAVVPGPSPVARAAAVIAWLVPRARVLLDSAGSQGTPLDKGLPEQIAAAFTAPAHWVAWHPRAPAPLVPPDRRPEPAPPRARVQAAPPRAPARPALDATPWQRERLAEAVVAYPGDLRRWAREEADACALALLAWVAWFLAYAAWVGRDLHWDDEQRAYGEAVRRHRAQLQAGRDGARAHGRALLDIAVSVWFGVG